jgi:hypothetical protein
MIGHDDEAMEFVSALIAVVEELFLQELRIGGPME